MHVGRPPGRAPAAAGERRGAVLGPLPGGGGNRSRGSVSPPPRPEAGWRAQAVQPRFLQMQGQSLQLQCHVRPGREEKHIKRG